VRGRGFGARLRRQREVGGGLGEEMSVDGGLVFEERVDTWHLKGLRTAP
jgi:hypothetical protein